jgi:hypothetical protein
MKFLKVFLYIEMGIIMRETYFSAVDIIGIRNVTMEFLAKLIPELNEISPSVFRRLHIEGIL